MCLVMLVELVEATIRLRIRIYSLMAPVVSIRPPSCRLPPPTVVSVPPPTCSHFSVSEKIIRSSAGTFGFLVSAGSYYQLLPLESNSADCFPNQTAQQRMTPPLFSSSLFSLFRSRFRRLLPLNQLSFPLSLGVVELHPILTIKGLQEKSLVDFPFCFS